MQVASFRKEVVSSMSLASSLRRNPTLRGTRISTLDLLDIEFRDTFQGDRDTSAVSRSLNLYYHEKRWYLLIEIVDTHKQKQSVYQYPILFSRLSWSHFDNEWLIIVAQSGLPKYIGCTASSLSITNGPNIYLPSCYLRNLFPFSTQKRRGLIFTLSDYAGQPQEKGNWVPRSGSRG